jgi:hypothetical protein
MNVNTVIFLFSPAHDLAFVVVQKEARKRSYRLPDLPHEYNIFLHDEKLSRLSQPLNLIFSFASLEITRPFPNIIMGPHFIAIEGKIYHWIQSTHHNSTV